MFSEALAEEGAAPHAEEIAHVQMVEGVLGQGGVNAILELRALSDQDHSRARKVALVAERDTLYARRMGSYFCGCKDRAQAATSDHVLCFTYLKGLDGLAVTTPTSNDATPEPAAGKSAGTPTKDNPMAEPKAADAAIGTSQLDYLRRLASTEQGSIFAHAGELVKTFGRIARVIAEGGRTLRKLS